ncbi:hypothetical protein FLAG1_11370 [Fusarium langsethiae]|uniref:Uncharacterized protein n=1 Tax=Fusarium langsethiae TaxID=179993 RepID=A0A0M9EMV0_FUSLA|nr:hypothetical protein FLAG1_11370 [Fusarium langsethiae]
MFLHKGSCEIKHDRIPGLQQPLTRGHFVQACKDHNKLPTDDVLLKVEKEVLEKHLPQLKQLFKRYDVEKLFAVSVLHRHFEVRDGFNLVGRTKTLNGRHCYWTRRVANDTLNSSEVCAQKLILDEPNGWVPCEFRESSAPDPSQVYPEFFLELSNYLKEHDLTSTFGLEYIVPELHSFHTLEFRLPNDELLHVQLAPTEVASLRANDVTVTTVWRFSDQGFSENFCIPDENKTHPDPDPPKPPKSRSRSQEPQISIDNLFRDQYPWIRKVVEA